MAKFYTSFNLSHFSSDLAQIFTSFLTFDTGHIVAFKIKKILRFTPITQKGYFRHFSTNLAQIFTSLLTFDTDHKIAFKVDIFFYVSRL